MKIKYFISSLRFRTLFLSASGIFLGTLIAASQGFFEWKIFLFSLLTAVSLQILSNLANELGDFLKGTDNQQRTGPIRSIQQGFLSLSELKGMIFFHIFTAAIFGLLLVYFSFDSMTEIAALIMLILGAFCILAAIFYTVGKRAYGYSGWGDIFVFLFFGWVSVGGSYFLLTKSFDLSILLPASSIGFLATAVLNLNNIRDVENDKVFHKNTICVRMGEKFGKRYHAVLVICSIFFMLIYTIIANDGVWSYFYLLLVPLFVYHIVFVQNNSGKILDKQFPVLVMGTFLWAILAGSTLCY